MRNDFGNHVVGHQAEIPLTQVFQRECFVVRSMKFPADVSFLLFAAALYGYILETKLGHVFLIGDSFQFELPVVDTARNACLDGIHQLHGTLVSVVVQFVETVEIHQTDVIVLESHQDAQ